MSNDTQSARGTSGMRIAALVLGGLLSLGASVARADGEAADDASIDDPATFMEFMEYLGGWDASTADWMEILAYANMQASDRELVAERD
jgi:hypothetical protein